MLPVSPSPRVQVYVLLSFKQFGNLYVEFQICINCMINEINTWTNLDILMSWLEMYVYIYFKDRLAQKNL